MEARLPEFLAGAMCGLLLLGLSSLVRLQLAPSPYNRPSTSERYRVANDLRQPLAAVVDPQRSKVACCLAAPRCCWTAPGPRVTLR
jgi:hypothetical protein